MRFLFKLLISAFAVVLLSYVLEGVAVSSFLTAVFVALVLGLLNMLLRPILVLLTIPITLLTLGLFLLVINALMILLTDALVPGFDVDGFFWALLFSLLLSLVSWITEKFTD